MDGRTDGRTDRRTDRRTDGRTKGFETEFFVDLVGTLVTVEDDSGVVPAEGRAHVQVHQGVHDGDGR